jgi:hypothetical protein
MNELTLLIGSCDSYSFLWNNFIKLCDKYWEPECKKIIVSETLKIESDSYEFLTPGSNMNWSDRIIKAINKIDTEFIFFILDDYFLREKISSNFINQSINFLKDKNANKLIFTTIPENTYKLSHVENNLYKMNDDSDYLTSVQPAIWRKSFLLECMQKDWNPWQFEINGTELIKNKQNNIYLFHVLETIYFNAVRRGKIMSDGWQEFYQKENLN